MNSRETVIKASPGKGMLLKLYYSEAEPSKRRYIEHHHTELEISLVLEGGGEYSIHDKRYDIRPGDIFLFGTHEEHYITDIGERGIRLMNIHFEPRFIWASSSELFDAKYLKIFFDRSDKFENRLDRENPATAEIARLLYDIESEVERRSAEYELMVKVKLLTVLVLLIREYDYVNTKQSYVESAKFAGIGRAMQYLDEHLASPLTLDELAAKANLNKTYFISLFRKLNGITPWEYITARRVERSYELLKEGGSVLEVATKCGFNNASNFNRAFRKVTGMTPSEYRRSHASCEDE